MLSTGTATCQPVHRWVKEIQMVSHDQLHRRLVEEKNLQRLWKWLEKTQAEREKIVHPKKKQKHETSKKSPVWKKENHLPFLRFQPLVFGGHMSSVFQQNMVPWYKKQPYHTARTSCWSSQFQHSIDWRQGKLLTVEFMGDFADPKLFTSVIENVVQEV